MRVRAEHRWLLLGIGVLGGCSQEPGALAATLTSEALTVSNIQSMDVFIVVGHTRDGTPLACADLSNSPIVEHRDLTTLYHQFLAFANARLEAIPPGTHLLVAIDAYASADGTGQRVAAACAEGVEIKAGKTTDVTLVLSATSAP